MGVERGQGTQQSEKLEGSDGGNQEESALTAQDKP